MSTIWITGDHHFRHANILKYCNRDFPDIEAHDNALIDAWNAVVKEHDDVFYLGDFTLGTVPIAKDIFAQLNGHILVLKYPWHHDKRWLEKSDYSTKTSVVHYLDSIHILEDVALTQDGEGVPAVFCHYAFDVWDRMHYGSFHFHGHSHGLLPKRKGRLDVGVDMAFRYFNKYRPFALSEAIQYAGSDLAVL